MIARIQQLPQWQRVLVFIGMILGGLLLFALLTILIIISTARSTPRTQSVAIQRELTVREFAVLPDDDAYPAALAMDAAGTLYSGSYASGVLWRISPDGAVSEIAGTRDAIGSVQALATHAEGTLYVLDHIAPLSTEESIIWRLDTASDALEQVAVLPAQTQGRTLFFDDIALDLEGRIYVSERVLDHVWRLNPDGSEAAIWWTSPRLPDVTQYEPAGLAFSAARNSLIISDSALNALYEVPVDAPDPQVETRTLFLYDREMEYPGFDGVATSPEGEIFVAALGLNRVARLDEASGELIYLAGAFRGSSGLAYDNLRRRLFVSNWDQRSLLPVDVIFFEIEIDPHLPFAIDVIVLP